MAFNIDEIMLKQIGDTIKSKYLPIYVFAKSYLKLQYDLSIRISTFF